MGPPHSSVLVHWDFRKINNNLSRVSGFQSSRHCLLVCRPSRPICMLKTRIPTSLPTTWRRERNGSGYRIALDSRAPVDHLHVMWMLLFPLPRKVLNALILVSLLTATNEPVARSFSGMGQYLDTRPLHRPADYYSEFRCDKPRDGWEIPPLRRHLPGENGSYPDLPNSLSLTGT